MSKMRMISTGRINLTDQDFDLEPFGDLWQRFIKSTVDILLKGRKPEEFEEAVLYFFTKAEGVQLQDIRTFDGLCRACNVNSEFAAKTIFFRMSPSRRKWVCEILKKRGYKTLRTRTAWFIREAKHAPAPLPTPVPVSEPKQVM